MKQVLLLILLVFSQTDVWTCPPTCKCRRTFRYDLECTSSQITDRIIEWLPANTNELMLKVDNIQRLDASIFTSLERLSTLAIYARRLTLLYDFPPLPNLRHLVISKTHITTIGSNVFSLLKNLKSLTLNKNKLTNIHESAFSHLITLTELDLSENNFTKTPFLPATLTQLKKLRLNGNAITHIPPGIFWRLTRLEALNLGDNVVSRITNGTFSGLMRLIDLDLSFNRITSIDDMTFPKDLLNLRVLTISYNYLNAIKDGALSKLKRVTSLQLSYNRLSSINRTTFEGLVSLESLSLKNSSILSIEEGAFHDLRKLRFLYLSYNVEMALHQNTFFGLTGLWRLYLHDNKLESLKGSVFSPLTNLQDLYINNNCLKSISEETFFGLGALRRLQLHANSLTFLGKGAFAGLIRLQTLTLNANNLTTIKEDIFKPVTSVEKLYLQNNHLNYIYEGAFTNLTKLQYLNLNHNKLTSINGSMFTSTSSLRNIFMQGNRLTYIEKDVFSMLNNLRLFGLQHNLLTHLHKDMFRGLTKLEYLYLHNNSLSSIDKFAFASLTNILGIHLANNNLTSIEEGTFQNLHNLWFLRLDDNELHYMHKNTFSGLSSLQRLGIRGNRITSIHHQVFRGLSGLRFLDISENMITHIEKETFHDLANLWELNLHHNRLTSVHKSLFSGLSNVEEINMAANRLTFLHVFATFSTLTSLRILDLSGNRMKCTCYYLNALKSFNSTRIKADCIHDELLVDVATLTCDSLYKEWQMRELIGQDGPMENGNKMRTLKTVGKQFIIKFDFKPFDIDSTRSLVQFKTTRNNGTNNNNHKLTNIYYAKGTLLIRFDVEGRAHYSRTHLPLSKGNWHSMEIAQTKEGGHYRFTISVDGQISQTMENITTRLVKEVTLHITNPWLLRNLRHYAKDCSINNGGCDDECAYILTSDSINCSCSSGVLWKDMKRCTLLDALFISSGREILRSITTSFFTTLVQVKSGDIGSIAYAFNIKTLFYVELMNFKDKETGNYTNVWRYEFKRNSSEVVVTLPYYVERMTYDNTGGNIYFTTADGNVEMLELTNLSTHSNVKFIARLVRPGAVVVDSCKRLIFVTDRGLNVLLSYALTTGGEEVVARGLYQINALTIDRMNYKLYWGDSYSDVIETANYDGTCRKTVTFIPNTKILSMTYVKGSVYWIDGTSLWRTIVRTGNSEVQYATREDMFDIQSDINEWNVTCHVTCTPTARVTYSHSHNLSYLYPYNTNNSNNSVKLAHGHNVSHPISLSRPIRVFGVWIEKLYVSPKGFLSTTDAEWPITPKENGSILAAYAGDITNRFVGDVLVEETTNLYVCQMVWNDTESLGIHPRQCYLVIVTWIFVANITNGSQVNSFQAVLASNGNDTFIVYNYGSLASPSGTVGYTSGECSKLKVRLATKLSHNKKSYILSECYVYSETFIEMMWLYIITPLAIICALLIILAFSCCFCKTNKDGSSSDTQISSSPPGEINESNKNDIHENTENKENAEEQNEDNTTA